MARFRKPARRGLFVARDAEVPYSITLASPTARSFRRLTVPPTTSATGATSDTRRKNTTRSRTAPDELTKREYDEQQARTTSEEAWRQQTRRHANPPELGRMRFPLRYHTQRSTGSDAGWPDEVFGDSLGRRLLFMEEKKQSGKLTTTQVGVLDWLAMFRDSGNPGVEVYGAVRPMDSDAVRLTFDGATEAEGALHQWCLSSACEQCNAERAQATPVYRMSSWSRRHGGSRIKD